MNVSLPPYYRTYQPPAVANRMATTSRFGHTSNFTALINKNNSNPQAKDDYIAGLTFVGFLVLSLFMIWFLTIIVFKLLGKSRVGFLAGGPFDSDNQQGIKQDNQNNSTDGYIILHHTARSRWVRVSFVVSSWLFIMLAILTATQGITNLNSASASIHDSASGIYTIASEAHWIIQNYLVGLQSSTSSNRIELENILSEDFCPQNLNVQQQIPEVNTIRSGAASAVPLMEQLNMFLSNNIDGLAKSTESVMKVSKRAEEETIELEEKTSSSRVALFTVPFTIVPTIMMIAAVFAYFHISLPILYKSISWLFFPIFVLMVLFCCMGSALMIVGASVNNDFCLPGGRPDPDMSVTQMMANYGYGPNTIQRQVVDYYVGQCIGGFNPFASIAAYQPLLNESIGNLTQMLDIIENNFTRSQLQTYCGQNFNQFELLGNSMLTTLHGLSGALNRTLQLASCERIVPIYHVAIYDASCTYGVQALFWVFCGLLCMGFFGLVMITGRAAYQPNAEPRSAPPSPLSSTSSFPPGHESEDDDASFMDRFQNTHNRQDHTVNSVTTDDQEVSMFRGFRNKTQPV